MTRKEAQQELRAVLGDLDTLLGPLRISREALDADAALRQAIEANRKVLRLLDRIEAEGVLL